MKVALVGATGLVGTRMLQVLEERSFPVDELIPVASEKSIGRKVAFKGREWTVVSADEAIAAGDDRMPPVFCITESGHIDRDLTISLPEGVALMLSIIEDEYSGILGTRENPGDSLDVDPTVDPPTVVGTDIIYTEWETSSVYGSRIQSKWDQVQHLLSDLGRSENLNVDYGVSSSSANCNKITRTLENFGFAHGGTKVWTTGNCRWLLS